MYSLRPDVFDIGLNTDLDIRNRAAGKQAGSRYNHFLFKVANPVLILLLIPLFDKVVYPLLGKLKITNLVTLIHGYFITLIN